MRWLSLPGAAPLGAPVRWVAGARRRQAGGGRGCSAGTGGHGRPKAGGGARCSPSAGASGGGRGRGRRGGSRGRGGGRSRAGVGVGIRGGVGVWVGCGGWVRGGEAALLVPLHVTHAPDGLEQWQGRAPVVPVLVLAVLKHVLAPPVAWVCVAHPPGHRRTQERCLSDE